MFMDSYKVLILGMDEGASRVDLGLPPFFKVYACLFNTLGVSSQNVGAYPCRLAPACSRHERCGRQVGQAQGAAPTPNY